MANQSLAVSMSEVKKAKAKLASMRRSLGNWLDYRGRIDHVANGGMPGKRATQREMAIAWNQIHQRPRYEQQLATRLHGLLSTIEPDLVLPEPDLSGHPDAAVRLAEVAIFGPPAALAGFPVATTWMWPALIVGGLLVAVTVGINAAADVATEKERIACIQAGACTDYGFWLKGAAVVGLAWFVWKELGVGHVVRGKIGRS